MSLEIPLAGPPEAICGWSGPACTDVGGVGGVGGVGSEAALGKGTTPAGEVLQVGLKV